MIKSIKKKITKKIAKKTSAKKLVKKTALKASSAVKKATKKVAKKTAKKLIKKAILKASPVVKKVTKKVAKKNAKLSSKSSKKNKKNQLSNLFAEPAMLQVEALAPVRTQPVNPYENYPKVHMKCKRGSDASTRGQQCKSMRAYKLSKDGDSVVQFRCVACGHAWSVQVGGYINL